MAEGTWNVSKLYRTGYSDVTKATPLGEPPSTNPLFSIKFRFPHFITLVVHVVSHKLHVHSVHPELNELLIQISPNDIQRTMDYGEWRDQWHI